MWIKWEWDGVSKYDYRVKIGLVSEGCKWVKNVGVYDMGNENDNKLRGGVL